MAKKKRISAGAVSKKKAQAGFWAYGPLSSLGRYRRVIPVIMLIDILFLVVLAKVFLASFIDINMKLNQVSDIAVENLGNAKELLDDPGGASALYEAKEKVSAGIKEALRMTARLLLYVLLIWVFFQGLAYALLSGRRFLLSWGWFALLSSLGYAILILCSYLFLRFSIFNQVQMMGLLTQKGISLIFLAILLFLGYLYSSWYMHLRSLKLENLFRVIFILPWRSFLAQLKAYISAMAVVMLPAALYFSVFPYSFAWSMAIGISLLLPSFTFARILLVNYKL